MSRRASQRKSSGEKSFQTGNKSALRRALLDWYDRARRDLPWRARAGERPDPYRVWLSEIMLQQTTAAAVAPYFAKFLMAWPDVAALAAAPRDEVLSAWAGLGYYARARNLHAAAQVLARDGFPTDEPGWRKIPGVGPYTAAALAAIALDQPANVVDGNVERVMARLFAVAAPLPAAKPIVRAHAAGLVDTDRPGDWAQALMDLGATVCTAAAPKCGLCPLAPWCAAALRGEAETFPRRAAKAMRPERYGAVFVLIRGGEVLVVRRPDKGLLGGMLGLPTTAWAAAPPADALAAAPCPAAWARLGAVRHVFTHFALTLDVYAANGDCPGAWLSDLRALPTVFRKAALMGTGQARAH